MNECIQKMSCNMHEVRRFEETVEGERGRICQRMERRKYETEEEKQAKLPGIRDYSRQAYLQKREAQKLDELRDAIEDEKALFGVIPFPPH